MLLNETPRKVEANHVGDVIRLPVIRGERDLPTDGCKARIKRRRKVLFAQEPVDDLVMLHADTAPSEYCSDDQEAL
jgi:hypothetical protein